MRSNFYEQHLGRSGVSWSYVEKIPLDEIDAEKSLRNQARLVTPLDDELVESYAAAMTDGVEFPPLVLVRPGRGRYVLVDGNQRLAAAKRAKRKHFDGYVLDTKDQAVVDRLTWTWNNATNGRRLSPEEALEHAVSFVRRYGMEVPTAAREWGVSKDRLWDRLKVAELQEALDRQNVKRTPSLSDDKLKRMSPLLPLGEDVLAKAATVVATAGLGYDDVQELVRQVKRQPTNEAKVKAIDAFAESERVVLKKAETKNGHIAAKGPSPRDRLARLLRQVEDLLEEGYDKKALRPLGTEYREVRETVEYVVDQLTQLFGLGARQKVGTS
jgi:hypothetical protein